MSEEQNKSEMTLLLESMKEQEKMAKKTLWHQRIRTILVLVMVLAVVITLMDVVPLVKNAVANAESVLFEVQNLTLNASSAVDELMLTVDALDLENTLAGIDALVADSSAVVETSAADIQKSLEAISSLDIAGLNKSIKALEAVSTSIGRFFGYKG